ncbi:MAG: 4Fe-4S dicluster domain-containing protein, partial [Candidatus Altiarchaeota archaeon]
ASPNTKENETYTIDPEFKNKITESYGGRNLLKCFQCSTCTASCPVQPIERAFNPRRIIRRATLGVKEVLKDPAIWLCSTCYACNERCPQQVHISDVMHALQNLAVEEGFAPEVIKNIGAYVNDHGRLYEIVEFEAKRRNQLGLPQIKENPKDIQKIFEQTNLSKHIKNK